MNLIDFFVLGSEQNRRVNSLSRGWEMKRGKSKLMSMSTIRETRTCTPITTRSRKINTDFTNVGGLAHHLSILREVIIFPLIFSKIYFKFNIKAPRGVLFHGPPGTGKTFVAGALAAELNKLGLGKVHFFHRKGADILDKWVGESEKKLRELFERAAKRQPSIIFFDELDGLAPQRSKNNDQIHCSVVTTLLALMDGLDSMPGVIVIGATNRLDAIDPALRRPGRFDKELYFPLPSTQARMEILQVHTRFWNDQLSSSLITKLAEMTVGFSGSDIQALCTEAVLCCLKRSYPSVKTTHDLRRIRINIDSLKVEERDFIEAYPNFAPSTEKNNSKARRLSKFINPLLQRQLNNILRQMLLLWPHFLNPSFKYIVGQGRYAGRVLLIGTSLQGLSNHLLPAFLHSFEHLPAHVIDTPGLVQSTVRSARQNLPSILVLSRVDTWWDLMETTMQTYLISMLEDLHADLPLLLLATCSQEVPLMLHDYFYNHSSIVLKIDDPDAHEREVFFSPLFFGESGTSVQNLASKKKTSEIIVPKQSLSETRKILPLRACKLIRGCISSERLKEGKNLKRKHPTARSVPSKRNKSDDENQAAEALNSDEEICARCNKPADGFRKHISSVLADVFYSVQNSDVELLKFQGNKSVTTLYCKDNSKNEAGYDDANCDDLEKNSVYKLWKRTSHVVSDGMPVGHLELLYDTIFACINIHRDNLKKLLENLEVVLTHFEKQN